MSSFSGVVALAGEPESAVAATVEIEAGMLTLMAGGSQIGAWNLDEIEVEQTAGAFNLHADGEDLVLTTPDMTGFADAVGVVAAEPKREKRRRFGFRAGRGKAPAAEPEPAPAAVAVAPPPPAEDPHADYFAEPLAAAALDVDTPGFAPTPDLPAFLTEPDLPADPEPTFSTAPDMPAFPTEDEPSADSAAPFSPAPGMASPGELAAPTADAPETTFEEPIDHLEATSDPYAAAHAGFATAADEPDEVSSPMTAAPNVARDVTEPVAVTPAEVEFAPEPALREETPETGISFAPAPAHDDEREANFDPPQPTSAAEPGFSFATPEPIIDPAPQATPEAGPPPAFDFATSEPVAEDPTPAVPEPALDFATPEPVPDDLAPLGTPEAGPPPAFDFATSETVAEDPSPATPEPAFEALSVDPIAEPATEAGPAPVAAPDMSSLSPDLTPIGPWSDDSPSASNGAPTEDAGLAADTWRNPDPGTGRWPQPDPADEPAVDPADETVVEPDSATTDSAPVPPPFTTPAPAAPQEPTEVHPLDTEHLSPPAGASSYTDDVSDAASRDVPAIAGIAAVATPDRYVTVEPDQPDESVVERPDHGADMASQEEISAWIADVNGDIGADEDAPNPVLPSRFETLRNRSAENYSDENVLSTPLTMAMFFTAIALALGALLSWGIYELSDSFPVERLVSAIAAFAVATGVYLGWRQDRRVAGSIFAIGGGILALAAVYAYAREAEIGIGFLVATAGAVVAVVLGIVGVTRFGHGPDPRIRE